MKRCSLSKVKMHVYHPDYQIFSWKMKKVVKKKMLMDLAKEKSCIFAARKSDYYPAVRGIKKLEIEAYG